MNLQQDMIEIVTLIRTVQYRLGEHVHEAIRCFDDRFVDDDAEPDTNDGAIIVRDIERAGTLIDVAAENLARIYHYERPPHVKIEWRR